MILNQPYSTLISQPIFPKDLSNFEQLLYFLIEINLVSRLDDNRIGHAGAEILGKGLGQNNNLKDLRLVVKSTNTKGSLIPPKTLYAQVRHQILIKLYQDSNIFLGKLIVTTFANLASLFVWSLDLGECEDQEALQRRLSVKSGSILTGWSLRALVLSNMGTGFSVPQGLFLHVLALSALGPNPFYFLSLLLSL